MVNDRQAYFRLNLFFLLPNSILPFQNEQSSICNEYSFKSTCNDDFVFFFAMYANIRSSNVQMMFAIFVQVLFVRNEIDKDVEYVHSYVFIYFIYLSGTA